MVFRKAATRVVLALGLATACSAGLASTAGAAPDPSCPSGAYTTVYDDAGNPVQACVDQAPVVQGSGNPKSNFSGDLPATGGGTDGLWIASGLVACGAAVSLLARRRAS